MSNHHDRKPPVGQGAAIASLVALVACALAGDALARQSPAEPAVAEQELAARVARSPSGSAAPSRRLCASFRRR